MHISSSLNFCPAFKDCHTIFPDIPFGSSFNPFEFAIARASFKDFPLAIKN